MGASLAQELEQTAAPLVAPAPESSTHAQFGAEAPSSYLNLNRASEGASVWSRGRAEAAADAAAPEVAQAPSQVVEAGVEGGHEVAGSLCAGLKGDPSDWLTSGGALGYLCAMQVMPAVLSSLEL